MKVFISTIFVFLLLGSISQLSAQDQQEAWKDYMTPGPIHQMMAESAGEWTSQLTMWQDPAQPPMKYDVTITNEMIMGGRYLKTFSKGDMMGMPFEGMMLLGYDNAKKEFTAVWYDNFGTGTSVATGKYNEQDSTLHLLGSMVDPATGKDIKYREDMKFIDKDNQIMTMYVTQGGQEFKNMEQVSTRKK
jgi:hypothetical protein